MWILQKIFSLVYWSILLGLTLSNLYKIGLVIQYYRFRKRKALPVPPPSEWPRVTVQLPLYNEKSVVQRLIHSVMELDYPKDKLHIQVLDDSTDETVEIAKALVESYRAIGFQIDYVRRSNRKEFKAGALAYGLTLGTGDYVAIFDADFLPSKNFLKATIPHFQNADVGMVQTKWSFLNGQESQLTRTQEIFLNAHFVIEHSARFRMGSFFNFNGTAGVWRKTAILDAGGWSGSTLTEDLDLSYRAQLRGWKFIYREDVEAPSELPSELSSLKTQQYRWVKGMTQVAAKLLPVIWNANIPRLKKWDASLHLFSCFGYLYTVLTCLLFVPYLWITHFIHAPVWTTFATLFFAMNLLLTFGYFLASEFENRSLKLRHLWDFPCLLPIGVGLSWNGARAVLSAWFGNVSDFVRTPKFGMKGALEPLWLEGAMLAYLVLCVVVNPYAQVFPFSVISGIFALGFFYIVTLGVGERV